MVLSYCPGALVRNSTIGYVDQITVQYGKWGLHLHLRPHTAHTVIEALSIGELDLLRMFFYLYSIGVRNGTAQYRRRESRIIAARVM